MGPALGGVASLFAFLGGTWFPLTGSGGVHEFCKSLPSYWLTQAGQVGLGGRATRGARGAVVTSRLDRGVHGAGRLGLPARHAPRLTPDLGWRRHDDDGRCRTTSAATQTAREITRIWSCGLAALRLPRVLAGLPGRDGQRVHQHSPGAAAVVGYVIVAAFARRATSSRCRWAGSSRTTRSGRCTSRARAHRRRVLLRARRARSSSASTSRCSPSRRGPRWAGPAVLAFAAIGTFLPRVVGPVARRHHLEHWR